jgi:hypothetical protein
MTDRSRDPVFMLAVLRGQTPPGIEPGSPEDRYLRDACAWATSVVDAAPPMTPEQVVTVAAMLRPRTG